MTNSCNFQSYPPFFRVDQDDQQTTEDLPKESAAAEADNLPIIDFQLMHQKKLSEICKEWGMFRLVNHGVPEKLLSQLNDHADQLFSLNFETKQALFFTNNPIFYFWGSPALNKSGDASQTAPCPENINWLEGLNVPLNKISQFQYEDSWLESFRCLLDEYGRHQTKLAKTIFEMMAKDLKFSPTKSNSYLSPATGFLRFYRYLRCPIADQRWGIPEHSDSSVLSILHQDEVGGLQVYSNSRWIDVDPVPNTLIVNLGDMMQAISDDKYVSVKHRVKVNKKKERMSFGYFVFPDEDAVIETSNYKPFTYADFRATKELDFKTFGIKIGLPRFRIEEDH